MDSKEFTSHALKTEFVPEILPVTTVTVKAACEMAVACSNVMDILKKHIIYGKPVNFNELNSQLVKMNASGEYMEATLNYPVGIGIKCSNEHVDLRLLHASIGMFTESGEMLEALLKHMNGTPLDVVNFAEEIGDSDWYKAIAHTVLDISEEQIRKTVIAKLAKRFPEKFSSEAALIRDLESERKILEEGMKPEC